MRVPYAIIELAVKGDAVAMKYVEAHFENYVNRLSLRKSFDGEGNVFMYIDEETKKTLLQELRFAIWKFKTRGE